MKKLLSMLLCSLMVLSVTQNVVHAEEDNTATTKTTIPEDQIIKNDETGIPDSYLYGLALVSADKNQDSILTKQEALETQYISGFAGAPSKLSLKGISYFKNVTDISTGWGSDGSNSAVLPKCELSNFEEIKDLKKLQRLQLFQIKNVDLKIVSTIKSLTSLEILFCSVTDKNDLSLLSNLDSLDELDIRELVGGINAYHLDLISNCLNLKSLTLEKNNLSNIKAIANLKNLECIRLTNNKITDMSCILSLTKLKELSISSNLLKSLPNLKSMDKLVRLDIGYNYLTKEEIVKKVPSLFVNDEEFMKSAVLQRGDIIIDDEKETVGDLEKPYTKPLGEIPADLVNNIYDSANGITVSFSNSVTIPTEVFKAAVKEKKVISFEVVDENGQLEYSWTFDGKKDSGLANSELNLEMKFSNDKKEEIEKITKFKDSFYMNFTHHGDLPLSATMKVKVSDKYKDGDIVFLYYYNEEKNIVEQGGPFLTVKDGYVEFDITHCSTYFLSKESNEKPTTPPTNQTVDRPKTSDEVNATMFISLMIGSIAVTYFLRKKRLS